MKNLIFLLLLAGTLYYPANPNRYWEYEQQERMIELQEEENRMIRRQNRMIQEENERREYEDIMEKKYE